MPYLRIHSYISIQHLFLFIMSWLRERKGEDHFNTTLVFIYRKVACGASGFLEFQYNTCFYLSLYSINNPFPNTNFNTTLVFIYHVKFIQNGLELMISIQHLFLFILSASIDIETDLRISIQHLFLFIFYRIW